MSTIFSFKDTCSGPVFVLGNGPSLDEIKDFSALPYPTFGVNRSWRRTRSRWHFVARCDRYFRDMALHGWIADHIFTPGPIENCHRKLLRFGSRSTISDVMRHFVLVPCDDRTARKHGVEWGEFPFVGFSMSGAMAMKTARYMGFDTLYLLGFDGGKAGHFGGDDPPATGIDHDREYFREMKWRYPDLKVYNCSMGSGIATWPKKPIGEVINEASENYPKKD